MMLEPEKTVLLLIDVQEKLAAVMQEREALVRNLQKLVSGLQALGIPIVWLEQNPDRMGPTIPELRKLLDQQEPLAKMCFSCCGAPDFQASTLLAHGRNQFLLAGIETHVCVTQTAWHLLDAGIQVQVVADAVSSRNRIDHTIALQRIQGMARLKQAPPPLTTTEAALFELMRTAEHPRFRDILKLVR